MHKPTYNDIKSWLEDRRSQLAALHMEMGHDEVFLEASCRIFDQRMLQYLPGFPKNNLDIMTTSIAVDAVESNASQIWVGDAPVVRVLLPPGSHRNSQHERELADELGQIYTGLLRYINAYRSESPLWQACWHMVSLGMGVLSYAPNYRRRPKHPFKLANGKTRKPRNAAERLQYERYERSMYNSFPYEIRAVHPRTVFFDPYHEPIENVILEEYVSPAAFAHDYPELNLPTTGQAKNALLVTYCSPEWYGQWLDGRPLTGGENGLVPNPTGILWFAFAKYGAGFLNFKGEWEYAIQGALRAGRNAITAYTRSFNINEFIKTLYAFAPIKVTGDSAEREQVVEGLQLGPAAIWETTTGVSIDIQRLPEVPESVWREYPILIDQLEQRFGLQLKRGAPGPSGEPAQLYRTRLTQGQSHLRQAKLSFQQMLEKMLMDLTWIQKHELGEPLNIITPTGVIKLDPERIPLGAQLVVDSTPPTEEQKAFRLQTLIQMSGVTPRAVSQDRLLEAQDVEDKELEKARILADEVASTDGFRGMVLQMTQQALQARGLLPVEPQPPSQNGATVPQKQSEEPTVTGGGFALPNMREAGPPLGSEADINEQVGRFVNPAPRVTLPPLS